MLLSQIYKPESFDVNKPTYPLFNVIFLSLTTKSTLFITFYYPYIFTIDVFEPILIISPYIDVLVDV